MKKICISGPSGTGKTTLAKWVAKHYNIPYIDGSGKKLWGDRVLDTEYITCHADIMRESLLDPIWGMKYQERLLDYRAELMKQDNYIMDRGPFDNIVYFLIQNSSSVDESTTAAFIEEALELYKEQTHQIITILAKDTPLERDGKRVNNRFYQMMTDAVYERVFKNQLVRFKEVKPLGLFVWDMQKRREEVMKFMSNIITPTNGGKIRDIKK
jgi:adenylate kinase family enzyme